MRGDLALAAVKEHWDSWRGQVIEPTLRESLARLLPAQGVPAAPAVGAYWTRSHDVQVDIVGADREPIARRLLFLGSIKWRERSPFDDHDLVALQRHRALLTDDPVPLIAVSRSGTRATGLNASFEPSDLLGAWP